MKRQTIELGENIFKVHKNFFIKYVQIKPKPLESQHTENIFFFLKSRRLEQTLNQRGYTKGMQIHEKMLLIICLQENAT